MSSASSRRARFCPLRPKPQTITWSWRAIGEAAIPVICAARASQSLAVRRRTTGSENWMMIGAASIESLLVPIDFSESAQEALEYAVLLAKRLNARVRLVHAMTAAAYPLDFALFGVTEEQALRKKVHEHLEELVSVVKADGIVAESVCETGAPAEVILKHAKEEGAGAIVMGTHGRRGLSHLALGSVAEYVVRHAACPIFTVKSPRYRYRRDGR